MSDRRRSDVFVQVLDGKARDGDGLRAQLGLMQTEQFVDLSYPWLYSR